MLKLDDSPCKICPNMKTYGCMCGEWQRWFKRSWRQITSDEVWGRVKREQPKDRDKL